ncbi:MAG: UvrB/UvrC motif-containing protein, partial [Pseudomonadota bacterium]
IQTIGRAARNADGKVIMYADKMTGSMERAIAETNRRREKQVAYNDDHGITPQTVKKNVEDILQGLYQGTADEARITAKIGREAEGKTGSNLQSVMDGIRKDMQKAAENLEFEEAARLRDELRRLETMELAVADDPLARQSTLERKVAEAEAAKGRSTAGRAGTSGKGARGKAKRRKG